MGYPTYQTTARRDAIRRVLLDFAAHVEDCKYSSVSSGDYTEYVNKIEDVLGEGK